MRFVLFVCMGNDSQVSRGGAGLSGLRKAAVEFYGFSRRGLGFQSWQSLAISAILAISLDHYSFLILAKDAA